MPLTRCYSPLPLADIELDDPFWSPRLRKLAEVTLPQQFDQIKNQTGRLRNFERAAAGEQGGHEGRYYDDSDVYKWLEACAYALKFHADPNLKKMADEAIRAVVACQRPDGYLNTFFQLNHPDKRFLNLSYLHEMYCLGHLFEAGVAWDEALGDRRLLDVSIKAANLLWETFGPGKREGYCGHQEVELALIRLSEHVGEPRYRELAKLMVERRGHKPTIFDAELQDDTAMALSPWATRYLNLRGEYFQDHAPIREHRIVVGHAVRAMYFYTAAVQLAEGDEALETALRSVWTNMTQKRMYLTGGIGSTAQNEGFTQDYDLPNFNSYAETCAAVGLALWGLKMGEMSGESDFLDVAERAIFNGALAGINLGQDLYFYANPLESRGNHQRVPWFDCACCPPNIARLIGSIARFAVGAGPSGTYVHLPISGTYTHRNGLSVAIQANYPHESAFEIKISGAPKGNAVLRIRIPEWCDEATFDLVGDESYEADFEAGYAVFDREWKVGETLKVDWNAEPKWVQSHPGVVENLGRVALTFGPLVMCLERTEGSAQQFLADVEPEYVAAFDAKLLGGVPTVVVEGYDQVWDEAQPLYDSAQDVEGDEAQATFIPYYAWGNRGPSSMLVWVRRA